MGVKKSVLVENMNECVVCGSPYIQIHHVFYGVANRSISDRLGFMIPLCQEHHTGNTGIHFNKDFDMQWKIVGQMYFEANMGNRNDFINTFGKSYI